ELGGAGPCLPVLLLERGERVASALDVPSQPVRLAREPLDVGSGEVLLRPRGITLGGEGPDFLAHPLEVLLEPVRDPRHLLILAVDRVEAAHPLELLHLDLASLLLGGLERLLDVHQLLGERGARELLLLESRSQPRELRLHLGQGTGEVPPVGFTGGEVLLELRALTLGRIGPEPLLLQRRLQLLQPRGQAAEVTELWAHLLELRLQRLRHLAEPGRLEVPLLVDAPRPAERLLLQLEDRAEVLELLVERDAPGRPRLGRLLERVSGGAGRRWRNLGDRSEPTCAYVRLGCLRRAASRRVVCGGPPGGGGGGGGARGGGPPGGRSGERASPEVAPPEPSVRGVRRRSPDLEED